ncbi:midas domain-containing protein [Helicobacter acinonychis]|uniref:Poly E-rich protein n=1 Tax=Helicobacter acinonychis (strain Sheeba) TaxID=382638 RepID=Q17X57_HELAH|nr:hypothetical protein [Helicobacter acinonychis]CAJ99769.1 conserved hypothetical protein [Helicobacter acinonychis str. Sheeba]STP04323.1 polyE-rich protein [Helicobacter acinonychis]
MTMILFSQNPMIKKLLESVSKKLELLIECFERYEELSARLKKDLEWLLIADDECLEKLDQADWLELKEMISQNQNSVCMHRKGNEVQPFLEGFEMKIKKPFLPTEMLKILQKKLGFQPGKSEPNPTEALGPTQETLEANWDALENLGDLEALAKEDPNAEERLLPTLNTKEEKEIEKEAQEETQEVAETPQDEETTREEEIPKDDNTQESAKTPQELETPQEETQEQEGVQGEKAPKKTQDPSNAQELEAMQELVKEIQENSNHQEDKEEVQEVVTEKTQAQELENQEIAATPQETETQELEIPKELETPQAQETETPQKTQEETQDNYETIEDIPEPVMAKAMGEALPLVDEALMESSSNENATQKPKESVTETPQENAKNPQKSDETSSSLELRLNLQDLLKSLNQESLKSLLENKTLSIKITLENKNPHA